MVVGTLGMACAVPGSPPGLSVFVDGMLEDLSLSRDHFSLAYTLGTIMAGVLAPWGGYWVDRYGVRPVASGSFLALGLILVLTAYLGELNQWLTGPDDGGWVAFSLLFIAFGGIRVFGMGFGMTACRSMIFKWFEGRRNWAMMINGVVLSLTFSSAPVLLHFLAGWIGPRPTWLTLAALFAVGMVLLTLVFYRDSPEACGMVVEQGGGESRNKDVEIPEGRDYTAAEAIRTRSFWIINLCIALHAVIGTGAAFHLVAIGGASGLERVEALSLFLPIAFFNILSTLFLGWYSSRLRVRTLVLVIVGSQIITLLGLLLLESFAGRAAFIVGSGVGWGAFGILISVPWPRFFGRRHLGAINGMVTSTIVITSGVGPYLFGLSYGLSGSFSPALYGCLVLTPVCLATALCVRNPRR